MLITKQVISVKQQKNNKQNTKLTFLSMADVAGLIVVGYGFDNITVTITINASAGFLWFLIMVTSFHLRSFHAGVTYIKVTLYYICCYINCCCSCRWLRFACRRQPGLNGLCQRFRPSRVANLQSNYYNVTENTVGRERAETEK